MENKDTNISFVLRLSVIFTPVVLLEGLGISESFNLDELMSSKALFVSKNKHCGPRQYFYIILVTSM